MTVIAAWSDMPAETVLPAQTDSSHTFLTATLQPWYLALQLTGLLPTTTTIRSRTSSSCTKVIKLTFLYLIFLTCLACHIAHLSLYLIPQTASILQAPAIKGQPRPNLAAILLVHSAILAATMSIIMLFHAKSILRETNHIGNLIQPFLSHSTKSISLFFALLIAASLIALFVVEFYFGSLQPSSIGDLSKYLMENWPFSSTQIDLYTVASVIKIVSFINKLSVYVLQTVLCIVLFVAGNGLGRLAANMEASSPWRGSKPDMAEAVACLQAHAAVSRSLRSLDAASGVSILTLALYVDDVLWIGGLIERWNATGIGWYFGEDVNVKAGGGAGGMFVLAMMMLLVRSWLFIRLSDKVGKYAVCTYFNETLYITLHYTRLHCVTLDIVRLHFIAKHYLHEVTLFIARHA